MALDLARRLRGPGFTQGLRVNKSATYSGRALLLYKSIRNRRLLKAPLHTNELEIIDWVWCLNELGFEVDLIDRGANPDLVTGGYDLFLGLGTSGSSKNFLPLANNSGAPKTILIATTPHPAHANRARMAHLIDFETRYGLMPTVSRIDPTEPHFQEHLDKADSVMVYGLDGEYAHRSFSGVQPLVRTYGPSSLSKTIQAVRAAVTDPSFVAFSGDGFVAKGVDLIVETFLRFPEFRLSIFGPPSDSAFFSALGDKIDRSANIVFHGFLPATERNLKKMSSHGAQICASPSEGSATSVATLMSVGVPSIATIETGYVGAPGLSLGNFGPSTRDQIAQGIATYSLLPESSRTELAREAADFSQAFTRGEFRGRLGRALKDCLS